MTIRTTYSRPANAKMAVSRRVLLRAAASLAFAAALPLSYAHAAWPEKPVRVIVPYPTGGSTDVLARLLAKHYADKLGQPFVVENRSGANGNIGAAAVATAEADGYTLLFSTTGPLSLNKLMYANTPFDPVSDFTPILLTAEVPLVLVANPGTPAHNMAEFIKMLKAEPGKYSYASAGNGSMGNMAGELIQDETGTKMLHVPYRGSAPALTDLLAGVVSFSVDLVPTYLPHIQAGKARALATLSDSRVASLPDVPTLREAGIPTSAIGWMGLVGPAGIPAEATETLNRLGNEFLQSKEGRASLESLGLRPLGGTPAEMGGFVKSELEKWSPIAARLAPSMK